MLTSFEMKMAANLVNESRSEEIHSLYLRERKDCDAIYYRCKETYGYYKKNYVGFRELIFQQSLVVINDGDNQLIVENMTKKNSENSVLVIRQIAGSEEFVKESLEILKKLFRNRNISKVKIVCFRNEILKDMVAWEKVGFEKEVEYMIGENVRVHYSFKFVYE